MSPFWQRLLTVVAGAALITVGFVVPAAGVYLVPAGVGVLGWAVPHPADKKTSEVSELAFTPAAKKEK